MAAPGASTLTASRASPAWASSPISSGVTSGVALGVPVAPARRFELLETFLVETPGFAFVRPLVGFETFDEGELIATDGAREIRSPCDGCTVFMPTREPIVGREAVYLTRPLKD